MAAGLILTTLAGAGADTYRSVKAVLKLFDLSKLYEPALKLQIVSQALQRVQGSALAYP